MENLILILISISFFFYLLSGSSKSKFLSTAAFSLLTAAFLGNLYLIIRHFIHSHRLPLTNTPETLLSLITLIIAVYLALEFKFHLLKAAGAILSAVSFLGLYSAFYIFKRPLFPLMPVLQSGWLLFHVLSCIIAYSFFTIAFVAALIYIVKRDLSLTAISGVMHRSISIGFLFLTLGIILGSVWGNSAWGHWWNWDPKETWALITWLIYAGYIHCRLFWNWQERKFAWFSILGFSVCLFTYLGVNFLLKGLHSYG